jgi:predicted nucleotidyltransferase
MDKREAEVAASQYVTVAKRRITFDKAVLFGSYLTGHHNAYSDIDIGLFVDRLDTTVDYLDLLTELYHMAAQINAHIEPHLFIRDEDDSGFAAMIEKTGLKLPV